MGCIEKRLETLGITLPKAKAASKKDTKKKKK